MDKKGAIEFSMTTIIVIVIAVALLAIALPWATRMMGRGTELTDAAFDKALQELRGKAVPSDRLVLSQEDFNVGIGDKKALAIGYLTPANTMSVKLSFSDEIEEFVDYEGKKAVPVGCVSARAEELYEWKVKVNIPGSASKGDKFGRVSVEAYTASGCSGSAIPNSRASKPITFEII